MQFNFETAGEQVAALVPYYDENGGNATKVFTTSGEIFPDPRSVRWILKRMARVYAVDLEALRERYKNYLGIKQGVPLPLSANVVLVPQKLRRVIVESDGAGGFVNVCAVEGVDDYTDEEGKFKSTIYLTGGCSLPCVFTRGTVEQRIQKGHITRERYLYYTAMPSISSASIVRETESGVEIPPEIFSALGELIWRLYNYKDK